jgi:hypothetical protein
MRECFGLNVRWVSAAFVLGCAGSPPPPQAALSIPSAASQEPPSTAAPSRAATPGRRTADTCSAFFPQDCFSPDEDRDRDGCPDPEPVRIQFASGSEALPAGADALLDAVAEEARQFAPGARLLLSATASDHARELLLIARGTKLQRALVERGVSLPPLLVEIHPAFDSDSVEISADGCHGHISLALRAPRRCVRFEVGARTERPS